MQNYESDRVADSVKDNEGQRPVAGFPVFLPSDSWQSIQGPQGADQQQTPCPPDVLLFRNIQGGPRRQRCPSPSGSEMKRAVAAALSSLKPEQRHLLLDLLKTQADFACLFAYTPGPGAEASVEAAMSAWMTPEREATLKQHLQAVMEAAAGRQGEPVAEAAAAAATAAPAAAADTAVTAAATAVTAAAPGAALTLTCVPEYESYGPELLAKAVEVVVSLKATSEVRKQGNVALTSVLDVSGSMSGRRLELLKETSHFLVKQVTRDDYLGFISYSCQATVEVPLMLMTANAKLFAHTVIESLRADGSTALYDGTILGMQQQMEGLADDSRLAQALLLCTDGEANVGPQNSDTILPGLHAQQKLAGRPCTIHTFGIGDGHSAQLLQAVSEAMSGTYYYIKDQNDVAPAYGDALGGLLSVVAKNVRVTIKCVQDNQKVAVKAGGTVQGGTVTYNDIYAEETRELLVSFLVSDAAGVPPMTGEGIKQLAEVLVEYVDPATGSSASLTVPINIALSANGNSTRNPLVITTAARYQTAEAIEKAQELTQRGDVKAATKLLDGLALQLTSMTSEVPEEASKQLDIFCQQSNVVRESMQAAQCRRDHASVQMQSAVTISAARGLKSQRAANVGVTASLPQAQMYDNASRAANRSRASATVEASCQAKQKKSAPH